MDVNTVRLKIYLIPIFIFFVALAVGVFFIYPSVTQIMLSRDEIKLLEERRIKLAAKAEVLSSVSEEQLRSDLTAGEVSLPSDKTVSGIIYGLEMLAASGGAKLTSFSTVVGKLATESAEISKELDLPNNVENIPVAIDLSGSYDAVQSFLSGLNGVNRLLGSANLTLQKDVAKLTLMVFYQLPAKTLGDILSPVEDITVVERNSLHQAAAYGLATPQLPDLPVGKPNPFQ